ncbi:MAG: acyl-CoA dehydrogenase family protein [Candidatus Dormibacteria bacterium]
MDFTLSDDQLLLRNSAREFLAGQCPPSLPRQMLDDPSGDSGPLWKGLAELGFTGLALPEQYGGQGLSFVDLVVFLEEAGRALLPGPFLSTVTASLAIAQSTNQELKQRWLPGLAAGALKASLCVAEPVGRWDATGVETTARTDGDSVVLDGIKLFCPDAHVADVLLIAARRTDSTGEDAVSLYAVEANAPGVTCTVLPGLDGTRRISEVRLAGVRVPANAEIGRGWAFVKSALDRGTVALCAEMVGGTQRALEMSVAHTTTRKQFDKPIGVYQAVSHRVADMLVDVENARSVTYYAAWAQDAGAPDASMAASMAKVYAGDAYARVAADAIQVHGGIGFTWEHDLHLYLKRAKSSQVTLGDANYHRELVAQAIDL